MTDRSSLLAALTGSLQRGTVEQELEDAAESLFADHGLPLPIRVATAPASGATRHHALELAEPLLRLARTVGAHAAVAQQLELLRTNAMTVERVCPVWGIRELPAMSLSADLRLVPIHQLRATGAREFFLPHEGPTDPLHHPKPRMALALSCTLDPVYLKNGLRRQDFTYDDKWRLSGLVDFLSLVIETATISCGEWVEYPSEGTLVGAGGWSGGLTHRLAMHEPNGLLNDQEAATRAFSAFRELPEDCSRRLRTPLRRLNSSHRREYPSERILEVGIALESLLSERDDPNDGISHRLRVRAARLLGGTASERQEIADAVRRFYALRSKVAHGIDIDSTLRAEAKLGKGADALDAQQVENLLASTRSLCKRIVMSILDGRAWPRYKELELGPP